MRKSDPLVSVIIPCYNKQDLVLSALSSVNRSSYTNVEIIVVNDGSTDPLTLTSLQAVHDMPNVRIINQSNQGLSMARNNGMSEAKGKYILFLDHDDLISKELIKEAVDFLEAHEDVAYVYPHIICFGEVIGYRRALDFNPDLLKINNYIPCTCLHRRNIIANYSFDAALPALEDWDFLLQLYFDGHHGSPLSRSYLFYRIVKSTSMTYRHSVYSVRYKLIKDIRNKYGIVLTPTQRLYERMYYITQPVLSPLLRRREKHLLAQLIENNINQAGEEMNLLNIHI